MLQLQDADQQALPPGGADLLPALGIYRLALRLYLADRRHVAADLGIAGDEPDRRRSSAAAGCSGAAAAVAGLDPQPLRPVYQPGRRALGRGGRLSEPVV